MSIEIKEQGDANFYTVIKDGNWLMQIQHNGEQTDYQQKENLKSIEEGLLLSELFSECLNRNLHCSLTHQRITDYSVEIYTGYKENYKNIFYTDGHIDKISAIESALNYLKRGNLKTSEEWQKIKTEITVIDPDGWDGTNFQFSWYEELIPEEEYDKRILSSTIKMKVK